MFDFLEDCNEQAERNAVRERLKSAPEKLLAECEAGVFRACADRIADSVKQTDQAVLKQMTAIAKHARRCVDSFPMPRGVFVTEEDRRNACTHLLDAFPTLYRLMQALEQASADYLRSDRLFDARRQHALATESLLCAAELALTDGDALLPRFRSLRERLTHENEKAERLLDLAGKHADLLIGFSKRTVPLFFARAEQVADLANRGRMADPVGTTNLLDRLGREADLLTDEILLTQRRASDLF